MPSIREAAYIHGNCVTVGCIPITDDRIKELYVLSVEARNNGQQKIPVHIFPDRLDANVIEKLNQDYRVDKNLLAFWKNLQVIYTNFETSKKVKPIRVNNKGGYYY